MIKKFLFNLLIICAPFSTNATILETRHIANVIPLVDSETWFLVDLDNTLFEGAEAYGHAAWFYDAVNDGLEDGLSKEEIINIFYPRWIASQKTCPVKPLEKEFISFITDLQNQGIVVMGFTHRQPVIADSTIRQVNSLNIDFTLTAPSEEVFSLEAKNPTLYQNGILFVGDFNKKGEIFSKFLNHIDDAPNKIVFIDDKLKNVEEVESVADRLGIPYTGVHYTAIDHAAPIYSREIAEEQYRLYKEREAAESVKDIWESWTVFTWTDDR